MFKLAYRDWQKKSQQFELRNNAFIDGKFVAAQSGLTYAMFDPVSKEPLAAVAACDKQDVDIAVKGARHVFANGEWSQRSPSQRKVVLNSLNTLISEHKEELAFLETLDMGKRVVDALHLDSMYASALLGCYAKLGRKHFENMALPLDSTDENDSDKLVGVVGAITPESCPLYLILRKMLSALAVGNCVIFNPPRQAPHVVLRVAELALEAGLPAGVLSVLPSGDSKVGKTLLLNRGVDRLCLYMPWGKQGRSVRLWHPLKFVCEYFTPIISAHSLPVQTIPHQHNK